MKVCMYKSYMDQINKTIHNESITLEHYNNLLNNRALDHSTRSIIETMKLNTEDHIALLNTIREDILSETMGDD